jgi:hypothetical protein
MLTEDSRQEVDLARAVAQAPTRRLAAARGAARAGLSALLAQRVTARAILTGPDAASAETLRALDIADSKALALALESLTLTETLTLCQRLLPPGGALLGGALDRLAREAAVPKTALLAAARALIRRETLDLDVLAGLVPTDAFPDPNALPAAARALVRGEELDLDPLAGPVPEDAPVHATAGDEDDVSPVDGRSEAGEAETAPFPSAEAAPLVHLLRRSGLEREEIARLLPAASRPMEGRPTGTPQAGRDTGALKRHLETLLDVLGPQEPVARLERILDIVWSLWPRSAPAQSPDPVPAASTPNLAISTGAAPPEDPAGTDAGLGTLVVRLAARLVAPGESPLATRMAEALALLEPDPARRISGLRIVAARLSAIPTRAAGPMHPPALAVIEALLAEAGASPHPAGATQDNVRAVSQPSARHTSGSAEPEISLAVTETAGLVLLHPFYVPLFERLGIRRDGSALVRDDLAKARGALDHLAGVETRGDPLHRVLLGLDAAERLPDALPPDADGMTLIDSLLRAAITRWGRLGSTSPDGLRETFLRRTGSLRFLPDRVRLNVVPGPFDMLLDTVPWTIGLVRLPWMPQPCFVSWRETDDA